jgi:dissimilatory sulfite reductase (desulfoviridin) alpha/beta subunit
MFIAVLLKVVTWWKIFASRYGITISELIKKVGFAELRNVTTKMFIAHNIMAWQTIE